MFFVEEVAGTWCTWCPRGAVWMERIHDEYTQYFAGVAVHNNDPMEVDEYDAGIKAFPSFSGFPSVIVDRTE
ncbi:MAG: thioredoxin family protein [Saprospiraceae bacterium]